MAMSRNDYAEIQCKLESQNKSLGYMLNTPGPLEQSKFIVDPQIRLQEFGANISVNAVNINSELRGINRTLQGRDCLHEKKIIRDTFFNSNYMPLSFQRENNAWTEQSRTIAPAWQVRGLENSRNQYLHYNPLQDIERNTFTNLSTRDIEKSNWALNSRNFNY